MWTSFIKQLTEWNLKRKRKSEGDRIKAATVTTFSGSSLPHRRFRVLGTVTSDDYWNKDKARLSIKLQANALGGNYIINYCEYEYGEGLKCFGDAVNAEAVE